MHAAPADQDTSRAVVGPCGRPTTINPQKQVSVQAKSATWRGVALKCGTSTQPTRPPSNPLSEPILTAFCTSKRAECMPDRNRSKKVVQDGFRTHDLEMC
jgi:hypothetical protein